MWWPSHTKALDFELELACVLRAPLVDATPEEATEAVGGWFVLNDWSARDVQADDARRNVFGPVVKSKTFANSIGCDVLTADALADWTKARGRVRVDGEQWCEGTTGGPAHTSARCSRTASRGRAARRRRRASPRARCPAAAGWSSTAGSSRADGRVGDRRHRHADQPRDRHPPATRRRLSPRGLRRPRSAASGRSASCSRCCSAVAAWTRSRSTGRTGPTTCRAPRSSTTRCCGSSRRSDWTARYSPTPRCSRARASSRRRAGRRGLPHRAGRLGHPPLVSIHQPSMERTMLAALSERPVWTTRWRRWPRDARPPRRRGDAWIRADRRWPLRADLRALAGRLRRRARAPCARGWGSRSAGRTSPSAGWSSTCSSTGRWPRAPPALHRRSVRARP